MGTGTTNTRRHGAVAILGLVTSLAWTGCTGGSETNRATGAPTITTAPALVGATLGRRYSTTVEAAGAQPMTWTLDTGTLPAGLVLDTSTGELAGTPTTTGTSTFTLVATNAAGTGSASFDLDVGAAPSILTTTLPDSAVGTPYTRTLAATGTAPLSWSITSGVLPGGMALDTSTGVLAGTPDTAGVETFVVQARNDRGADTQQLSLTVDASPTAPTIQGPASPLPDATLNSAYAQTFTATGTAPITWSITTGTLPTGLSLNATTGELRGTPTAAGMSTFTVTATNAAGTDTQLTDLTVAAPPSLASVTPTTAPAGATVTLDGSGFDSTPTNNTVFFGVTIGTVLSATPTRLTVEVPAGAAAGVVPTWVVVDASASNTLNITVDATTVHFVDGDAIGDDDGSSWSHAYTRLEDALSAAAGGDEIWVAEGSYLPGTLRTDTFTLVANAPVYGGFDGSEGQRSDRDPTAHPTVLSGDVNGDDSGFTNNGENVYHVVTAPASSTLDGMTVRGGLANGGGNDDDGGGIRATGAGVAIVNVSFEWCRAGDDGGAIFAGDDLDCTDCVFTDCYSGGSGGAIQADGGTSSTITRCVFTRNFASLGACVATGSGGTTTFLDSVFADNDGWNVGVLWINDDSEVRGCTFYDNTATGTKGITTNGDCTIIDCVFRGGSAGRPWTLAGPGASLSMQTCNVEGGLPGGVTDNGGNIDADPLFVDTGDLDGADDRWRTRDDGLVLDVGSPSVDTGTMAGASATDVTRTARPQGAGVDMGAYESR